MYCIDLLRALQLDNRAMAWLTKKKTMMVGIDVTHPGPGSREGTPSIAAVVASVDDSFVQFPASLRVQGTKKEVPVIPVMKWTRTDFFASSDARRAAGYDGRASSGLREEKQRITCSGGRVPRWRLGGEPLPCVLRLGELFSSSNINNQGQFDSVLEEELPQILSAFKKLNTKERKTFKPQLSIIICGKRHHAR